MSFYERRDSGSVGLGIAMFLVGLGAGAAAALLLAPRSGRETRKLLRRRYADAAETIGQHAADLRESGAEWLDKARDLASGLRDQAEEAGDQVRTLGKKVRRRIET